MNVWYQETIHYPPCDPNREYINTIEFTDKLLNMDSVNKEYYYSEIRISGFPKVTSYYSIISNDSLVFNRVTLLLGGNYDTSIKFRDLFHIYLCQPKSFKINYFDRF